MRTMILRKVLKIFCLLQYTGAGNYLEICCEHLSSFIISVSVSRLRPRGRDGRLSQIEDVCPRQDVTCADDTNKVVKVIFSVQSAKVKRHPNLFMCKSRLKIIIHINLLWNCSISSGILILFPHLHSLHP